MKSNKIGVIGPAFFSYATAITDSLNRNGSATYFDEKHSNSVLSKLIYRLGLNTLHRKEKNAYQSTILSQIEAKGIRKVLLLNTETLSDEFLKKIMSTGVETYYYLWDSLRNKPLVEKLLSCVTKVASFDIQDSEKNGFAYIPLFAERVFSANDQKLVDMIRGTDVSFVGTMHSDRVRVFLELRKLCESNGKSLESMLYYHSKLLYTIKCLQYPMGLSLLNEISTSFYSKERIAQSYFSSRVVVDVTHPMQTGLTSRTFEALRAGCLLVTSNRYAKKAVGPSLTERVFYYDSVDGLKKALFAAFDYEGSKELSEDQDYFLSLDRFVSELSRFMENQPTHEEEIDKPISTTI